MSLSEKFKDRFVTPQVRDMPELDTSPDLAPDPEPEPGPDPVALDPADPYKTIVENVRATPKQGPKADVGKPDAYLERVLPKGKKK